LGPQGGISRASFALTRNSLVKFGRFLIRYSKSPFRSGNCLVTVAPTAAIPIMKEFADESDFMNGMKNLCSAGDGLGACGSLHTGKAFEETRLLIQNDVRIL